MTGPQIRHIVINMEAGSDISCGESVEERQRKRLGRGIYGKSGIKQRSYDDAGYEYDANLMSCAMAVGWTVGLRK